MELLSAGSRNLQRTVFCRELHSVGNRISEGAVIWREPLFEWTVIYWQPLFRLNRYPEGTVIWREPLFRKNRYLEGTAN